MQDDDSLMPSGPKGNKPVIILLVAGSLMIVVAGILFLTKNDKPDKSKEPPKVTMAEPTAGKPLVVPIRPPLEQKDTETTEATAPVETDNVIKKNGKGRKKERLVPMGTLDPKQVNSFMNARFHQVKACYERRLKTNSFLEGKVDLKINISPSGKVTAITVNKDTVRDAEMLACVKRTIKGWEFPKPEGGRVIIAKTFNFKKKG